ncbi:sulfite oxidase-like protein [Patellaria atrata CBS 101060]|uniref:Sulfite oxidase-like protein n=1 Tax=Patellaria atrata CBS 101060 TaxID=1346257 RepID=A0A9P4VT95_9PEZI|nr:sulfite oxidase-like protein [Patellaria atrata CBS 101060]
MSVETYIYTGDEPLNREPPLEQLIAHFITEKDGFDRNHSSIPVINEDAHSLQVDGLVQNLLSLTVSSLATEFPQHTVICALQCAGNRRHTMRTQLKEVQGIDWFDGAVMNCIWTGPRLRDVLLRAGLKIREGKVQTEGEEQGHVLFACHQQPTEDDSYYGGSIPLARAMRVDADVIIALKMNGKPIPPAHGAPIRIIAPGIAGARSVKWLDKITVSETESPNFYQQRDYKILPPTVTDGEKAKEWWDKVPAIQDMPVNSVVAIPANDSTVELGEDGCIEVRGYALPSGDHGPVDKVELSGDEGASWVEAEILSAHGEPRLLEIPKDVGLKWAWSLWRGRVKAEKGKGKRVLSRATDKGGNMQVECPEWNLRGVAYNGYGEARNLEVV